MTILSIVYNEDEAAYELHDSEGELFAKTWGPPYMSIEAIANYAKVLLDEHAMEYGLE